MKRTKRIGAMVRMLTQSPNKIFPLQFFCEYFDAAKSSISEDILQASESVKLTKTGYIKTISGAKGGVKFVPSVDDALVLNAQEKLIEMLNNDDRLLGGGFIYTSDIMFDARLMDEIAEIFARKYKDLEADYVVTIETKGIPLASLVSLKLNLPLVVVRREAKVSEGSTISINYFSGSYDKIQRMSIAKRAIKPYSKAIIIDDFMRDGGSCKGIIEILQEFNVNVVATGVVIATTIPEKKKISTYDPIIYVQKVDETLRKIISVRNDKLF